MENKNIYVEIEGSNLVRRNILESAAESLILLKDLEEDINRFEAEEKLFKRFKNQMVGVSISTSKFKKLLPKIKEEKVSKKEVKKVVKKKTKPRTEIDVLKEEINDIEEKLNEL